MVTRIILKVEAVERHLGPVLYFGYSNCVYVALQMRQGIPVY